MNLDVDSPQLKRDNRILFITLAYIAAACLIFASFSHQWLVNHKSKHEKVDIGLRNMAACVSFEDESKCESVSNSDIEKMLEERHDESHSGLFVPMGWATLVECLLGAIGLIATATLALRKMRVSWPVMPQSIALLMIMMTLITAMLFVAKKPGGVGSVGVGLAFWLYGIGAVMGIAAAQGLSKMIRPIDPDLAAGAMNPEHY
jgi:hypothetical protein